MTLPVCTSFTYKNFKEDRITDVEPNPSFWSRFESTPVRIKVNLTYCDTIKTMPATLWGSASTSCLLREITTTAHQNIESATPTLPDLILPQVHKKVGNTDKRIAPGVYLRERITEGPCFDWILDGNKYVKDVAVLELEDIHGQQRIQAMHTLSVAVLTLIASSVIVLGIYKLYKRCSRIPPVKNAEELPIQFRPKAVAAPKKSGLHKVV